MSDPKFDTIIVGGGLAGLFAARLLSERGKRILVLEQSPYVGGLLASQELSKGEYYDFGTHYVIESGQAEIDELALDGLSSENCLIFKESLPEGNYFLNRLDQNTGCLDARHLSPELLDAARKEMAEIVKADPDLGIPLGDLNDYLLAHYGEVLTSHIFSPVMQSITGKVSRELPSGSLILYDEEESVKLKRTKGYDDRIAYPNRNIQPSKVRKMYPRTGGVGFWMNTMAEKIKERGGVIQCSSKISEVSENKVILDTGETFCSEDICWTIAPALVARLTKQLDLLDCRCRPTILPLTCHYLKVNAVPMTSCHWITNYSPEVPGYRYTFYSNLLGEEFGNTRICVEELGIRSVESKEFTAENLLQGLVKMGVFAKPPEILHHSKQELKAGLPLPDKEVLWNNKKIAESIQEQFPNWHFLGASILEKSSQVGVLSQVFEYLTRNE